MTPQTIWNFKQNKPTLIVRDIREKYPQIPEDFIYEILLKRGVFKWLAVRRNLIKLKDEWKNTIRELNRKKTPEEKGFLKALERCRKQVRALCHSERWQAPDFDRKASEYLARSERSAP